MKILLAIDGFEQGEAPLGKITEQSVADGVELRNIPAADPLDFTEIFWDENLYGSNCGDRENYMRAGACGSQKSGNTANVAAAVPMLQQNGYAIAAAFPELVSN